MGDLEEVRERRRRHGREGHEQKGTWSGEKRQEGKEKGTGRKWLVVFRGAQGSFIVNCSIPCT